MAETKKDPKDMTKAEVHQELEETRQKLHAERKLRRDLTQELTSAPSRQLHGFVDFIREKGVVGLAVGLAFGTAATALVAKIVDTLVTPTVNLLIGQGGLQKWNNVHVHFGGSHTAVYDFGDLINALINFLAVAFVIYFVVKGLKLDRLDKKPEDAK